MKFKNLLLFMVFGLMHVSILPVEEVYHNPETGLEPRVDNIELGEGDRQWRDDKDVDVAKVKKISIDAITNHLRDVVTKKSTELANLNFKPSPTEKIAKWVRDLFKTKNESDTEQKQILDQGFSTEEAKLIQRFEQSNDSKEMKATLDSYSAHMKTSFDRELTRLDTVYEGKRKEYQANIDKSREVIKGIVDENSALLELDSGSLGRVARLNKKDPVALLLEKINDKISDPNTTPADLEKLKSLKTQVEEQAKMMDENRKKRDANDSMRKEAILKTTEDFGLRIDAGMNRINAKLATGKK